MNFSYIIIWNVDFDVLRPQRKFINVVMLELIRILLMIADCVLALHLLIRSLRVGIVVEEILIRSWSVLLWWVEIWKEG